MNLGAQVTGLHGATAKLSAGHRSPDWKWKPPNGRNDIKPTKIMNYPHRSSMKKIYKIRHPIRTIRQYGEANEKAFAFLSIGSSGPSCLVLVINSGVGISNEGDSGELLQHRYMYNHLQKCIACSLKTESNNNCNVKEKSRLLLNDKLATLATLVVPALRNEQLESIGSGTGVLCLENVARITVNALWGKKSPGDLSGNVENEQKDSLNATWPRRNCALFGVIPLWLLHILSSTSFHTDDNVREKEAPQPRIQRSTYLIFWLNGSRAGSGFQFTLKTLNVVPLFTWKSLRRIKNFLARHQSSRDAEVSVFHNLFIFARIFNEEKMRLLDRSVFGADIPLDRNVDAIKEKGKSKKVVQIHFIERKLEELARASNFRN
ncbi:hypothetical protein WN51_02984 [Melipona quadrifasciata]|uniref:Uncharacterized protein n=1 Tax=Melipona quadrifasciata TaxID=166423 RepID=A0A0M8ZXY2_9HYME|nr:hypothetical protein WN51_02984 [Melipona quadrifasciata]